MAQLRTLSVGRWFVATKLGLRTGLILVTTFTLNGVAQDPASSQCGQYVEAYKGGAASYAPYLKAAEQVAQSRDAQAGTTTYSAALHASAPSANALWLNNWCLKSPLKGFTEASSRLLDELTGQAKPANAALPTPTPQIVIVNPQRVRPSACKVGDSGPCTGCSVSCGNGEKARCKSGTEVAGGQSCAFQSSCSCVVDNKGVPAPTGQTDGTSACKVGNNGACSGCSISCTDGETPSCKQGTIAAGGDSCAFQAKCQCK